MTATAPPGIRSRLRAWFFEGELPAGPAPWLWTALGARILGLAALRFYRERRKSAAASLAYSTLLALLPVVVLAISLIEYLAPDQRKYFLRFFVETVFPATEAHELRKGVIDYIETSRDVLQSSSSSGVGLRIAGVVLLLYFAANLISGVDLMVGEIWGTGGFRALVRRLTAYWTVATLGPVLLALSIVGTTMIGGWVGSSAGGFLVALVPFAITWFSAFAFFRLMPHTGARTGAALTGAAVAGTLWEGSKLLMSWYLSRPQTLLSALGFVPAAILWMYVSWVILIYGMEVTYVVHHGSWRAGRRAGHRALTGRAREEVIVAAAVAVAREFDAGRLPDRARLAELLRVGEDEAARAVGVLADAGIVVSGESGGYRPARGTAGIGALEVVKVARGAAFCRADEPASAILADVDARGEAALAGVSLQDLARNAGACVVPPSDASRPAT